MPEAILKFPQRTYTGSTVDDLIAAFRSDCRTKRASTRKGYEVCLNAFSRWAAAHGVTHPTKNDIQDYIVYLDSSDLKPGTRTQYLRAVKQMCAWAKAEDFIDTDITKGVKGSWKANKKRHKKDALGREDVQKIAATIDRSTEPGKRLYAMFLLGVVDGLRTIEISRANIEDIKTVGGRTCLYIWGKGYNEADTPVTLPAEVKAALDEYIASRTDNPSGKSPLFVSTSNRSKGQRIAPTTISTILKEMLKAAGYDSDRLTAHSLRHTSGTGACKVTGKNLLLVQQHLRHENPETSEIYIHEVEGEDRDTEERVYKYFFSQEQDDPRTEAINLIQTMSVEKLDKALAILRALQ